MGTEKYAFVGAPCSGKTAVVEGLKQQLGNRSNVQFVAEPARLYFANHPEQVFDTSTELLLNLQDFAMSLEQEAHALAPQHILCDRSVLDYAVFAAFYNDPGGAEMLYKRIEYYLPTYDKFFLCSPDGVPHKNDDIRHETDEERNAIHEQFERFLNEKKIPYILLQGTLEERMESVREHMKPE